MFDKGGIKWLKCEKCEGKLSYFHVLLMETEREGKESEVPKSLRSGR